MVLPGGKVFAAVCSAVATQPRPGQLSFFIYDNGNIGNLNADDDLYAGESKDDECSCEYLIADHLFTCTALQPRP